MNPWLPLLLGLLIFLILIGPGILDPGNIAWLSGADPSQSFLGWSFFRGAPWTAPPGLNPAYGLELNATIFLTDSIPLLAFLFKPFSEILPFPFQYHGFWVLSCFFLQAWFGWKLAGLITADSRFRLAAVVFFLLSPPFLARLAAHYALVAHWTLLAALFLALTPNNEKQTGIWPFLVSATALIHGYLLAMVLGVWMAAVGRRLVMGGKRAVFPLVLESFLVLILSLFALWMDGFFLLESGHATEGFGRFRMNLVAPINPQFWSLLFSGFPQKFGEYEGFNYLGLGMMILLAIGIWSRLRPGAWKGGHAPFPDRESHDPGSPSIWRSRFDPQWLPLGMVAAGAGFYALSNHIGVGPWEVALGFDWFGIGNMLRVSGRFFWIAYYLLYFWGFLQARRAFGPRKAGLLLWGLLALQIVETSPGWTKLRVVFSPSGSTWETRLTAPFWEVAGACYDKIRALPPAQRFPQYRDVGMLALRSGMETDAVYLARVDGQSLLLAQALAGRAMKYGAWASDSLYLLYSPDMVETFLQPGTVRDSDLAGLVDGLFVIAPGWRSSACVRGGMASRGLALDAGIRLYVEEEREGSEATTP